MDKNSQYKWKVYKYSLNTEKTKKIGEFNSYNKAFNAIGLERVPEPRYGFFEYPCTSSGHPYEYYIRGPKNSRPVKYVLEEMSEKDRQIRIEHELGQLDYAAEQESIFMGENPGWRSPYYQTIIYQTLLYLGWKPPKEKKSSKEDNIKNAYDTNSEREELPF